MTKSVHSYGLDGQLASATDADGAVSEFLWDGLALIRRNGVDYLNEPHPNGGSPILASDGRAFFNDILGTSQGTLNDSGYEASSLTAFGDGADGDAFFTGKPKVDDALSYAFLFRNYRPDNGKWLTADPMGYPDGWNNLAYCNNWVNNCVDYRGCACQIVTYSEVCFGFSHRWVEVQKDGVLIASAGFYPSGGVSTWGDIGAVHFGTQETHIFDAEKTQRCLYEVSETDAKTVISTVCNTYQNRLMAPFSPLYSAVCLLFRIERSNQRLTCKPQITLARLFS